VVAAGSLFDDRPQLVADRIRSPGLGLVAQPACVIVRRQDQRHAVTDFGDLLIGVGK
jgi:hypothetical protein